MLRYQRNHIAGCKSGDSCRKCSYWIEGRHLGKRWHQSLKTTDAKTAAALVQRLILTGKLESEPEENGITIGDAVTKFFAEQESRGAALSHDQITSQISHWRTQSAEVQRPIKVLTGSGRVRIKREHRVSAGLHDGFHYPIPPVMEGQHVHQCKANRTPEDIFRILQVSKMDQ